MADRRAEARALEGRRVTLVRLARGHATKLRRGDRGRVTLAEPGKVHVAFENGEQVALVERDGDRFELT